MCVNSTLLKNYLQRWSDIIAHDDSDKHWTCAWHLYQRHLCDSLVIYVAQGFPGWTHYSQAVEAKRIPRPCNIWMLQNTHSMCWCVPNPEWHAHSRLLLFLSPGNVGESCCSLMLLVHAWLFACLTLNCLPHVEHRKSLRSECRSMWRRNLSGRQKALSHSVHWYIFSEWKLRTCFFTYQRWT